MRLFSNDFISALSILIFLLLGIFLLFDRDPDRVYTTFAKLSDLCNF